MPNLENLRKQAKQYLRWHRARHYPVATQIRTLLPRYRDLDDQQVLASHFLLSDAQELVARKLGYESWEALHKGIASMSTPDIQPARAVLGPAEPQLFVADIAVSCAFYTDKLGFAVAYTYGDPPFYGQVRRDAARLNLRCVAAPLVDPALCARQDYLAASITVDDAKPLFLEFQSAGVPFHQTLRTEPWGGRTFIVRDPDDNLVLFAGKGE